MEGSSADVRTGQLCMEGLGSKNYGQRRLGPKYCLNSVKVAFHTPPPESSPLSSRRLRTPTYCNQLIENGGSRWRIFKIVA